jgi:FkbM family methyltransferase
MILTSITKIFGGISRYGFWKSFLRLLVRLIPNNLKYPYYAYRKFIFGNVVISINGVKMFLDLKNDDGLCRELVLHGKREGLTVDYLLASHILKEGDVALDVGGNIGYYALIESKLVGDTGKVFAIEPVKANFDLLNKNVSLNKMTNVTTSQMAMGAEDGYVDIYVREKKNLSSLTVLPGDEKSVVETQRVPMGTVDAYAKQYIGRMPHLVRMDVEGFEASILEGMKECLKSNATLLIEFHPMFLSETQKDRIYSLFKESGYTHVVVTVNPKTPLNKILQYLNRKIGIDGRRDGYVKECSLEEFRQLLSTSPRVFNGFVMRR